MELIAVSLIGALLVLLGHSLRGWGACAARSRWIRSKISWRCTETFIRAITPRRICLPRIPKMVTVTSSPILGDSSFGSPDLMLLRVTSRLL